MKTVILESHIPGYGGWGNGYVVIPDGNKFHGMHYDEINNSVDVHYGLTFSELVDEEIKNTWGLDDSDLGSWIVGFDTLHHGDDINKWPMEAVQGEADNLLEQLIELS